MQDGILPPVGNRREEGSQPAAYHDGLDDVEGWRRQSACLWT